MFRTENCIYFDMEDESQNEWKELPNSYLHSGMKYVKLLVIEDALYELGSAESENQIMKYDLKTKSGWIYLNSFLERLG